MENKNFIKNDNKFFFLLILNYLNLLNPFLKICISFPGAKNGCIRLEAGERNKNTVLLLYLCQNYQKKFHKVIFKMQLFYWTKL